MTLVNKGRLRIGGGGYIGRNSKITAIYDLSIEECVYIGSNCTIEVDGVIEAEVMIANNVGLVGRRDHDVIGTGSTAFRATTVRQDESLSLPTTVKKGAWLGFGSIIMSGVTVGERAVVAAGAVVTKDVEPRKIVAGNPARVIGDVDHGKSR